MKKTTDTNIKRKKTAAPTGKKKKNLIKKLNIGTSSYRKQKRKQIDRRRKQPKTLSAQREQKMGQSLRGWINRHYDDLLLFMIPFFMFSAISVYALVTNVDLPITQFCVEVSENLFGSTGVVFYILLIALMIRYGLGHFDRWRNSSYDLFGCLFFAYFLMQLIIQHNVNKMISPLPPTRGAGYISNFVIHFLQQIIGDAGTVILLVCGTLLLVWKLWQYYVEKEQEELSQDRPVSGYWDHVYTAEDAQTDTTEDVSAHELKDLAGDFKTTYGLLTTEKAEKPRARKWFALKGSSVINDLKALKETLREISKPVEENLPVQGDSPALNISVEPIPEQHDDVLSFCEQDDADTIPSELLASKRTGVSWKSVERTEVRNDSKVKPCVDRARQPLAAGQESEPYEPDFPDPAMLREPSEDEGLTEKISLQKPVSRRSTARTDVQKQKPLMPITSSRIHSTPLNRHGDVFPRRWKMPNMDELMDPFRRSCGTSPNDPEIQQQAGIIESVLRNFGAPGEVVDIQCGPTFSRFGVEPGFIERAGGRTRVRIKQIESLEKDLTMALSVEKLSIEAPIPNKKFIGIQIQNKNRVTVTLREVMESNAFKAAGKELCLALGKDINGEAYAADLTRTPHLLIAGATGSGKSVCLNAILCCLLLQYSPDQLKLILVDPKRVELSNYNGLPHLITPVVTEVEKVGGILQWLLREMDMRNLHFKENGVRNIQDYNQRFPEKALPYIVLVIDELANLMAEAASDVETSIIRLAQTARAMGIHLIIATQRPSRDVLTGTIKGNLPTRIAFGVSSHVDSQVILDRTGAENLFGKGDMLYLSTEATDVIRLQCVYVSDAEIYRIVSFWKNSFPLDMVSDEKFNVPQPVTTRRVRVPEINNNGTLTQLPLFNEPKPDHAVEGDVLYDEAVKLVRQSNRVSANFLVSTMSIGFSRANKLLARMEDEGIISPPNANPAIPRKVLDYGPYAPQNNLPEEE